MDSDETKVIYYLDQWEDFYDEYKAVGVYTPDHPDLYMIHLPSDVPKLSIFLELEKTG